MRRFSISIVLIVAVLSQFSNSADARRFRRTGTTSSVGVEWTGHVGMIDTDQEECQQKANQMARHGILSHSIAPIIGFFEGIGMGGHGCATCRPSSGMSLTGDASAVSSGGIVYRVRSWR